jgi:hypothetical protein
MNKVWETRMQRLWLVTSAISLLCPLLLFSGKFETVNAANAVTVLLAIVFVLSLPVSFFSLPLMALFKYGIELELDSMFGAYFNLVLLNIFGYLQWFWLMPKFFNRGKELKLPTILENN